MIIVGIDEVGRGCWAGPLVTAAVILSVPIEGLNDSKLLTKKKRQTIADQVYNLADAVGLGWVEASVIDELGLTKATSLAMERALHKIKVAYDQVIIDGNLNYLSSNPKATNLIKADSLIPAVSAASVVAKVARDNYMIKLSENFPEYLFEEHVGYGTAKHLEKLKEYGVSSIHRKSFKPIRQILDGALFD